MMVFLLVECVAEQQGGNKKLAEMRESLYAFSSSAIVDVGFCILVITSTDEKSNEKKSYTRPCQ